MTKQSIVLITVAALLAAVYVAVFTDWFRKPSIQILPQIRPTPRTAKVPAGDTAVYPVSFMFDKKYQFTEIKVVAVDDPHAVWHLISDSNSVPVKAISYGARIKGMKPKVPRAEPEALQPDVPYHLYLVAGNAKGEVKFKTHELVKPSE
jgi:hypothetical protein